MCIPLDVQMIPSQIPTELSLLLLHIIPPPISVGKKPGNFRMAPLCNSLPKEGPQLWTY